MDSSTGQVGDWVCEGLKLIRQSNLAANMPNWQDRDVPRLLEQLSPNCEAKVWSELWTCLCDQGEVFRDSFAALPILTEKAEQWAPLQRNNIIPLAAAIIDSEIVAVGNREDLFRPVEWVVPRLQQCCRESLAVGGLSQNDFIDLLQAGLSLDGDQRWGRSLNYLGSGEFPGVCPRCECILHVVIGKYGLFVTPDEWIRHPPARRRDIHPSEALPTVGQWMLSRAIEAKQQRVANWIPYMFGTSGCAECGEEIEVEAAINP